ncbi:unnamed protein product [Caenorhabditis brenneri]
MSKPLSYKIQRDNKEEGSSSANGTEQQPSKKRFGAWTPENVAATSKEKPNYLCIKLAKCMTVDRPNALPISTSDNTQVFTSDLQQQSISYSLSPFPSTSAQRSDS